ILGYFLFFFVIPVNLKKDSMFIQFHARQGGVLFFTWLLLQLLFFILLFFLSGGFGSSIIFTFIFATTAVYLFFMIVGMVKVALGERYRMPVIADIALFLRL
ncbi:MAG: DUF4870 domain-containing protein, partial [Thermoplasmatota archaeon]